MLKQLQWVKKLALKGHRGNITLCYVNFFLFVLSCAGKLQSTFLLPFIYIFHIQTLSITLPLRRCLLWIALNALPKKSSTQCKHLCAAANVERSVTAELSGQNLV